LTFSTEAEISREAVESAVSEAGFSLAE